MPVINSFTQSPAVTQILGYIFVLMGILVFYICITPHMNNIPANITLSVLFGISTIILIVFSVLSSYIDPSDSIVKQYYEALKNQKPFNSLNYAYCNIC